MSPGAGLLFAAACAAGAVARYMVDGWIQDHTEGPFPWGTWAVNVSGSLILGLLAGWARTAPAGAAILFVLGTGFCGALTTFSTFTVETVRLSEEGERRHAVLYAGSSVLAGLAAAGGGLVLGSWAA